MSTPQFRVPSPVRFAIAILAIWALTTLAFSQTPRGNRVLALDTNGYDGQLYPSAAADAIAQGVTTTSIHLKWNQIESSPGVFTGPDAVNWQHAVAVMGYPSYPLNLILVLGTLDACQRDVPSDLATTAWNDPTMELRFQYLLNWLWLTAVNAGQTNIVVAISVGDEVDSSLSTNTANLDNYSDYTAFVSAAQSFLTGSTTWNTVPVGVSTTFGGISGQNGSSIQSAIATLNAGTNEVMYTYYPSNALFQVENPYSQPIADTGTVVSLYPGRTIDIIEAGYQTSAASGSSSAAQQTFVSTMFGIWDAYYPAIRILLFLRQADWSVATADGYATTACSGAPPIPAAPAAPSVTPVGGAGSANWQYYVVAMNSGVRQSLPGAVGQTSTGVTSLTSSAYNQLSWAPVAGASWYDVIRASSGGSPTSVEKIGSATGTTFDDTGLAASYYIDVTYNLEEYLRTLGLRYYDPVGGTYDKLGWTQLWIEAHARGW